MIKNSDRVSVLVVRLSRDWINSVSQKELNHSSLGPTMNRHRVGIPKRQVTYKFNQYRFSDFQLHVFGGVLFRLSPVHFYKSISRHIIGKE